MHLFDVGCVSSNFISLHLVRLSHKNGEEKYEMGIGADVMSGAFPLPFWNENVFVSLLPGNSLANSFLCRNIIRFLISFHFSMCLNYFAFSRPRKSSPREWEAAEIHVRSHTLISRGQESGIYSMNTVSIHKNEQKMEFILGILLSGSVDSATPAVIPE